MTDIDKRYVELYVKRRRLMTRDARKNAEGINILSSKIEALRATGDVSDKAIELAPYVPWR
mgnify:CR=1 FL=1